MVWEVSSQGLAKVRIGDIHWSSPHPQMYLFHCKMHLALHLLIMVYSWYIHAGYSQSPFLPSCAQKWLPRGHVLWFFWQQNCNWPDCGSSDRGDLRWVQHLPFSSHQDLPWFLQFFKYGAKQPHSDDSSQSDAYYLIPWICMVLYFLNILDSIPFHCWAFFTWILSLSTKVRGTWPCEDWGKESIEYLNILSHPGIVSIFFLAACPCF